MRYGENPHQKAAFYTEANPTEASVATAKQLQGKELSFNNIADTDAALECVKQFDTANISMRELSDKQIDEYLNSINKEILSSWVYMQLNKRVLKF